MRAFGRLIFFSCILPSAVWAETLTPSATNYDFDSYHDGAMYSCAMMLEMTSLPSPEAGSVRLDLTRTFADGQNSVAQAIMTITIADVAYGALKTEPIQLTSAAFESPTFNSSGRMGISQKANGGIMGIAVAPETTTAFIKAFIAGDFQISFVREGQTGTRTYKISNGPPVSVVDRFTQCSVQLLSAPN